MPIRILPGKPYPLGASFDGAGVNFAVFSENAEGIDLCLFDGEKAKERERAALPDRTASVYHGYVEGLKPGALYGFRARGPWEPAKGQRFNDAKLLVDPYARAIANDVDWRAPMFPYDLSAKDGDLVRDDRDDAAGAPKSVVVDGAFDWGDDKPPAIHWADSLVYEVHVKGMTARHPEVPAKLRGTYAGLATEPIIEHLRRLGVTAVELLPVHEKVDDKALTERGLKNYWGYNTLGFFAPAGVYASAGRRGEQVVEFKRMVKALHAANIEVILDVVYNHTCEGDQRGAMFSLKGLDNRAYYRLNAETPRLYADFTGCGNSLDTRRPEAVALVLDSLRYWVTEMHVDGFRFDLATTLARGTSAYERFGAFMVAVYQDPILSRVKLIAEPWDVGEGGYQVGGFPAPWREWNGKFRDAMRRFWMGDAALGELGYRLTGSSDLYAAGNRGPTASVNFVTAHDGFTLADLVSYERKHNEQNGEGNRDGSDSNDSSNHGVEGPTNDPKIAALRVRQVKNLFAMLFVSAGVPMLSAGDEIGRSQGGNNNAYCQDNAISWHDWGLDAARLELLDFARRLSELRRAEPVLRRRTFYSGGHVRNSELKDIIWFREDGREMTAEDWSDPKTRALGMLLNGEGLQARDVDGAHFSGSTLLVLLNGGAEPAEFVLPQVDWGDTWDVVVDTGATKDDELRGPRSTSGTRLPPRRQERRRPSPGVAVDDVGAGSAARSVDRG